MEKLDAGFWNNLYLEGDTGWNIGYPSTPIKNYIDQLTDKSITILIPGCGNGYEGEYAFNNGFKNVYFADYSEEPLRNIKERIPNIPDSQLIQDDFFNLTGMYDLIFEQTFFCALNKSLRKAYVTKMHDLLKPGGRLVGVMFGVPKNEDHPPFGGSVDEYKQLFSPSFKIQTLEPCYNSIPPRQGQELFVQFVKE